MTREQFDSTLARLREECARIEPARLQLAECAHVEQMLKLTTDLPADEWQCSIGIHSSQGDFHIHPSTPEFRKLIRAALRSHLADLSQKIETTLASLTP